MSATPEHSGMALKGFEAPADSTCVWGSVRVVQPVTQITACIALALMAEWLA